MKKYYYLLLIFLLVSSSFIKSQQLPRDIIHSEFIPKAKTNDLLYVNDTVVYLMSKSPLEAFPGYNDLYSSFNLPQVVGQPWMPLGVRVNRPAAYHAIWCLRDGMLYLSDIDISNASFCEYKSFFPNNEQYNLMEELTETKFDKNYPLPPGSPLTYHNTTGMMPATWSNDTILIKISRGQYLGGRGELLPIYCQDFNDTIWLKRTAPTMEYDKWIKIPREELIFKNGKLISRETKDIY